jgi:hypothetical protein
MRIGKVNLVKRGKRYKVQESKDELHDEYKGVV